MMRFRASMVVICAALSIALPAPVLTQASADRVVEGIRAELMQLPYCGVFDVLAFGDEKGTVTLQGSAYSLNLKASAERAVKRVSGVDEVINKTEDLPPSTMDDDIRWRTYY